MTHEIERGLAFLVRLRNKARRSRAPGPARHDAAAVHVRLSNLERQLDEVKGRINGLLFLLAGAVATQVILKLFA